MGAINGWMWNAMRAMIRWGTAALGGGTRDSGASSSTFRIGDHSDRGDFMWRPPGANAGTAAHLQVDIDIVRQARGGHKVEACLRIEECEFGAGVRCFDGVVTIALGNDFAVPERYRRQGLATAALAALVSTALRAARLPSDEPHQLFLSGYFVGDGRNFAAALCNGSSPTKERSAAVDVQRMKRAAEALHPTR